MKAFRILNNDLASGHVVRLCRPTTPPLERVLARMAPSYHDGMLTNGRLVHALEEACADRLGVRHVVAVSSCTAGLMLAVRAVTARGTGLLPSFTFCASAHALAWNNVLPTFAECDPDTFQLDPQDATRRVAGSDVILPVHVFGAPCDVEALEAMARAAGSSLIFDAAHAFGATRKGRPIGGFGDAEVFSLSPTKPLTAGEGGLVATNHDEIAEFVRLGRDYGNPGDYNSCFAGLNGRMSEFHAAMALESLGDFDENLARRRAAANLYADTLAGIPGIAVQTIDSRDESTYKDFTVVLDEDEFGLTAADTAVALAECGVETRRYFSPPVHRQDAYRDLPLTHLPVTDQLAGRVLSLPIYPAITPQQIDYVCEALASLHQRVEEVTRLVAQSYA